MKHVRILGLFFLLAFSFVPTNSFANSAFCEGYQEGFKEGHCDGKLSCIPPIPPICPIPNIGESTYRDGYNRGFKEALRKSGGAF